MAGEQKWVSEKRVKIYDLCFSIFFRSFSLETQSTQKLKYL